MRRPTGGWLVAGVVAVLLGIDQLSKLWVQSNLSLYSSVDLVPELFRLSYYVNRGAIGGIGGHWQPTVPLLIGASAVLIGLLILLYRYYATHAAPSWRVSLFVALSITPLLSHAIDRLRQGYIVDFLHFAGLPVFNFADLLPHVALVLLALELGGSFRARRPAKPRWLAAEDGVEAY